MHRYIKVIRQEAAISKRGRTDYKRRAGDAYDTVPSAVAPLLPFLPSHTRFAEPAAGKGALVDILEKAGHVCTMACDINPRHPRVEPQSLTLLKPADLNGADMVISNLPWSRQILHPMITHLRQLGYPAWLLLDASWAYTQQAALFLPYCERIVVVGRVKWIPGTAMSSLDDAAWFKMMPRKVDATIFHGQAYRPRKNAQALEENTQ